MLSKGPDALVRRQVASGDSLTGLAGAEGGEFGLVGRPLAIPFILGLGDLLAGLVERLSELPDLIAERGHLGRLGLEFGESSALLGEPSILLLEGLGGRRPPLPRGRFDPVSKLGDLLLEMPAAGVPGPAFGGELLSEGLGLSVALVGVARGRVVSAVDAVLQGLDPAMELVPLGLPGGLDLLESDDLFPEQADRLVAIGQQSGQLGDPGLGGLVSRRGDGPGLVGSRGRLVSPEPQLGLEPGDLLLQQGHRVEVGVVLERRLGRVILGRSHGRRLPRLSGRDRHLVSGPPRSGDLGRLASAEQVVDGRFEVGLGDRAVQDAVQLQGVEPGQLLLSAVAEPLGSGGSGTAALALAAGFAGCDRCRASAVIEVRSPAGTGSPVAASLLGWVRAGGSHVLVLLDTEADEVVFAQREGGAVVAFASAPATLEPDVPYELAASFDGELFRVGLDRVVVIEVPSGAADLPSGRFALAVRNADLAVETFHVVGPDGG